MAHPRSQTPEPRPHEMAIQDVYFETDPLASMPRGLVLLSGSERCLLSHPDNSPSQVILEIRLRGSGISIHGPSLRTVPGSWLPTKCVDEALSPLRQMGICILNYLDDWLILDQSEAELLSHRSFLLSRLE